ncbi:MAG: exo-alpha-sialidase [Gemmatimonadaceae bacterium]|nr:exo-alpha-sialidase [Gemmatimonadaceae bacterium]
MRNGQRRNAGPASARTGRLLCSLVLLGCARVPSTADSLGPRLALEARVDVQGTRTREPMVVQHGSGALLVAGYAVRTQALWRSTDGGARWDSVAISDGSSTAVGNSDTDLAVAPDGTIYFASMTFDRSVGEGRRIAIGVSDDAGRSFRWTVLSTTRFDDRPWVKVAPDGSAHVIWNDGSGVRYVTSRDRGRTWTDRPRISARGGSSHLAIGPGGVMAVRVAPVSASGNRFDAKADQLLVSSDGGTTWVARMVPGRPTWRAGDLSRWVEPLAWDARGALYAAWAEDSTLLLARSADRGSTWQTWVVARGGDTPYYPFLIAQGDGALAVTWHAGEGERLRWHAARIEAGARMRAPKIRRSSPLPLDAFRWDPQAAGPTAAAPVRAPAGEYLAAVFLADGGVGVVTPVQTPTRDGFTWWKFR